MAGELPAYCWKRQNRIVITSYSIHYTKLYDEADPKVLQHDNIVIQQENMFYVTDGKIREKSSNSKITPKISVLEGWFLSNLEQCTLGGCLFENFNSFYWQAGGINLFANKEMEYKNLSFYECDNCLLMRIQAVINT